MSEKAYLAGTSNAQCGNNEIVHRTQFLSEIWLKSTNLKNNCNLIFWNCNFLIETFLAFHTHCILNAIYLLRCSLQLKSSNVFAKDAIHCCFLHLYLWKNRVHEIIQFHVGIRKETCPNQRCFACPTWYCNQWDQRMVRQKFNTFFFGIILSDLLNLTKWYYNSMHFHFTQL